MKGEDPWVLIEVLSPLATRFQTFEEHNAHPAVRVAPLVDTEAPRVIV